MKSSLHQARRVFGPGRLRPAISSTGDEHRQQSTQDPRSGSCSSAPANGNATFSSLIISAPRGGRWSGSFSPSFSCRASSSSTPADRDLSRRPPPRRRWSGIALRSRPQVQRKPSAPSSAMSKGDRLHHALVPPRCRCPRSDVPEPSPSISGTGTTSATAGEAAKRIWRAGAGGATFFGQTSVKAERIAYVIDYSAVHEVQEGREDLMRKELHQVGGPDRGRARSTQIIFFAGPAWVAGERGGLEQARRPIVDAGKGGHKFNWKSKGNRLHDWEHSRARSRSG